MIRRDSWGESIASNLYPREFSFAMNEDVSTIEFLSPDNLAADFPLLLSPQTLYELKELQSYTTHIVIGNTLHDH